MPSPWLQLPSHLAVLGALQGAGGHLEGTYRPGLVALSIVIAVVASYTALDLAARVGTVSGVARRVWLGLGAAMMGIGIWSMHFVGMQAFDMGMPVTYGVGLTALSVLAAIVGAWAALFVVSRRVVTVRSLLAGGVFMGLAINAMHYMGMSAMRMQAALRYDPLLFALSVLIAVGASVGALEVAFRQKVQGRLPTWAKVGSAALMGLAIAGMHYTGMAAAIFEAPDRPAPMPTEGIHIGFLGTVAVAGATLIGLGLTLLGALVDAEHRRSQRTLQLLADASTMLGRTLDATSIADDLAHLVTRTLADGCVVDVLEDDGVSVRRLAAVCPACPQLAARCEGRRFLRDERSPHPLQRVLHSGRPLLEPALGAEARQALSSGPEGPLVLAEVQAGAVAVVPLLLRERVVGALTAFTVRPRLGPSELAVLEELGRRAGVALENARLFHEAQEAVRARDEFLSIASHELKTPLTPLSLQLQRLERMLAEPSGAPVPPEKVAPVLDVAQRQTRRLGRLVSELLDVSSIRAGPLALRRGPVDLVQVVRDVLARLGPELAQSGSECEVYAEGPVVGEWDRARIEQVVSNLLTNAARYGQGRPIEVSVATTDGTATLAVRDRGVGIAPEHRRRIFERFERASSRNYGGLGLGLFLVRQIVESHGGEVAVDSEPGRGSTFTVRLPLRPSPEVHRAPSPEARP